MTARITAGELARIRDKTNGIHQDALPIDIPHTGGGEEAVKSRTQKSIQWAKCPHHTPSGKNQLTGLIAIDNKTLVFRDHTKKIGRHTIQCPGSGTVYEGTTSDYVQ